MTFKAFLKGFEDQLKEGKKKDWRLNEEEFASRLIMALNESIEEVNQKGEPNQTGLGQIMKWKQANTWENPEGKDKLMVKHASELESSPEIKELNVSDILRTYFSLQKEEAALLKAKNVLINGFPT